MNYTLEDLTESDCLMIQNTIVKYCNDKEGGSQIASGSMEKEPSSYETPMGEIDETDYWIVDRKNGSWLVSLYGGIFEVMIFAFYLNGKIYPMQSVYGKTSVLEPLSYIKNVQERSQVEKLALEAMKARGWVMYFGKES